MNDASEYQWMRVVLESLFDDFANDAILAAIRSPGTLAELRTMLERYLRSAAPVGRIPDGDRGDNLLLALLALRTKFDREQAFEKLEINIAMRERRTLS